MRVTNHPQKKKNKQSFKHVELTKEEMRTIEGGDVIKPPIYDPTGGTR